MSQTNPQRRPGGLFRELWSLDWVHYAAHLKRLSPEDRVSRFHGPVSNEALTVHARDAVDRAGAVIGWFERGVLRAAAEVFLPSGGDVAEAAFEVEEGYRNRGVGTELVARTLLWARNRGARRLIILTTRRNIPMLRAAQAHGAAFEFDLAEAEGVIAANAPSLRSHFVEGFQGMEAAWRWAAETFGRRSSEFFGRG